ncbi:MAG: FG-GAP repeat protein [Anaerolineae bacterium]|nr:FG-GAP repeat protein [Anaerolineae bacterium]
MKIKRAITLIFLFSTLFLFIGTTYAAPLNQKKAHTPFQNRSSTSEWQRLKEQFIQTKIQSSLAADVNTQPWLEQNKLTASDAAENDYFGWSVDVSGNTAVIGAPYDLFNWDGSTDHGNVYVYVRQAGVWTEQQILTPSDAEPGLVFGYSVAIDGDTVVVGAHRYYSSDPDANGAAYVFERENGVWTEQQKLTASDATTYNYFGYSVDVDGDTTIIGTIRDDHSGSYSGSAYVFVRENDLWGLQQKLIANDPQSYHDFGNSVSLSGNTAVIGANRDDDHGLDSGAAYVFTRENGIWSQQQKLAASDLAMDDTFGYSVAVSQDTIIVGSHRDDDGGDLSGSAYIFVREENIWHEQQKLRANDAAASDLFGYSVAISGETAVVGAHFDDDGGQNSGSLYIFDRSAGLWTQKQKIIASDPAARDYFGRAVAIDGETVVSGANEKDDDGDKSGAAYVFVPGFLWDGGGTDNNWSTSNNWLSNTTPGSTDSVYFGSASDKNALIDAAFGGAVANIYITDQYNGEVNFDSALTVSGNYYQHGGIVTLEPAHDFTVDGSFRHLGGVLQETRSVGTNTTANFLQVQNSENEDVYRGVDLTTTNNGLGSTTVTIKPVNLRTEFCTTTGANSPDYAKRCFAITPEYDATTQVTLWALTSEVPETVPNPAVFHFEDTGSWQELLDGDHGITGDYTWASGNTTTFSPFLMAEPGNVPTAVTLQSFSTTTQVTGMVSLIMGLLLLLALSALWLKRVKQ